MLSGVDGLTARVSTLAAAARSAGLPVVHVRTAFRPGYPEVGAGNALFSGLAKAGRLLEGGADTAFDPAVPPVGDEVVVTKTRIDPFWSTHLDVVLGGLGVRTLVVAGVVTSGALFSTVRSAANRDLRTIVVEDACADPSPAVHELLMQRVIPMTAEVVSLARFVESD
jgi:nicotinamidase-related amidase